MTRSVHVFYCDDVRQEASGKQSFIGVYGGIAFLEKIPGGLLKLCVVCTVTAEVKDVISDVTIKVYLQDGKELGSGSVGADAIKSAYSSADLSSLTTHVVLRLIAILGPLPVMEPSVLRTTVTVDGKEFDAEGLALVLADDKARAQIALLASKSQVSEVADLT